MKIILSHPTGNANVRAVARGFADAGVLHKFYTSIATFPGDILYGMGRISPLSDFRRRSYDLQLKEYIKTYGAYEVGRLLSSKLNLKGLTKHETGRFSVDSIYRNLDKRVAQDLEKQLKYNVNAVYAYEDGALETFKEAKQKGLNCLYDLPTGYWRAFRSLLAEEKERRPLWSNTFTGFLNSEAKLERKDMELSLADTVFVASKFTAKTLDAYPQKLSSVKVIPYGFPPVFDGRCYSNEGKKLKLLFVGKLSQAKGVADVFDAVSGLENYVSLTLVGSKFENKTLEEELSKHTYLGVRPHHEILKIMREHDVLLFPSLFDGFGMVMTEAMSQGTPVIASDRSAGPDLITHGKNGWLMPAGSVDVLKEILEKILDNREEVERVGIAALHTASSRPWNIYQSELIQEIKINNA